MAGSRRPGPLGHTGEAENLHDGTLIRGLSPQPSPIGRVIESTRIHRGAVLQATNPIKPVRRNFPPPKVAELRQGSRGSEVIKLQRELNVRMTPSPELAVDGILGPLTHQAVLQYQKAVSIRTDGWVGKQTWYHLLKGDKATIPQPPSRPQQPSTKVKGVAVKRPTPTAPARATTPPAQVTGVWEWPLEEKFSEVMRRTAPKLPGSMRLEFEALLSPTSLGIIAVTLVIWVGSHAFGVGETVDIALLIGGAFFLGMAVIDVAQELGDFLVVTSTAVAEEDLDDAADHLARAIAIMGIAAFIALLAKVARGRGRGSTTTEAPQKSVSNKPTASQTPSHKTSQFKTSPSEPPSPKQSVAQSNKQPTALAGSKYGGVKAVRVRSGKSDKIAVIGRSMDDAVEPYAKAARENGYSIETYSGNKISPSAQAEWKMLKKKYAPDFIPEDVVRDSKMFKKKSSLGKKAEGSGLHSS